MRLTRRTTPLLDERFLLLEALGRGGMASVYRAFDRVEQKLVALKVSRERGRAGPDHPLSAEFDAWSRLHHPNVVRAFELRTARDGFVDAGAPYLVLEHVAGDPANRALQPGRVSPGALETFTVQLLHGLAHVHAAGLVHRDLKPGNVLVEHSCAAVKLTDFGLASYPGRTGQPGRISGSLPYVSPEAVLGRAVDGRADLYSAGILLFHLATGRMPAPSGGIEALLRWHLEGPPADTRPVRPDLPGRLAELIRRLTSRAADRRPAHAGEALALLGGDPPRGRGFADPDRALRASLRLALDAVRVGARRLFELPSNPGPRGALLRQVRVWCHVHQLAFHELSADQETNPVTDLVFRLLVDRTGESAALNRRYHLDRHLPVCLAGGHPARDRQRGAAREPTTSRAVRDATSFLLDCSAQRPLVLACGPGLPRGGLADRVVDGLRRAATPPRGPRSGEGGLLLLTARPVRATGGD